MTTIIKLAQNSHDRFIAYYKDADNWSGTPLVGGNVGGDPPDRGYILNMKKSGLIETWQEDDCVWIDFTPAGHAYMDDHG